MEVLKFFPKHAGKIALQFSGGRDSLALLLLFRPHWEQLTVYYCDSTDAYPETLALIAQMQTEIPFFKLVKGKSLESRIKNGLPLDILPSFVSWPLAAQTHKNYIPLQSRDMCCYRSIMEPLQSAMAENGITLILRGQRDEDEPKSPMKSGDSEGLFTVWFPISDWSIEQVESYILAQGYSLPRYYSENMTSAPDCLSCTAWLETNQQAYNKKFYPETAKKVQNALLEALPLFERPFSLIKEAANG